MFHMMHLHPLRTVTIGTVLPHIVYRRDLPVHDRERVLGRFGPQETERGRGKSGAFEVEDDRLSVSPINF